MSISSVGSLRDAFSHIEPSTSALGTRLRARRREDETAAPVPRDQYVARPIPVPRDRDAENTVAKAPSASPVQRPLEVVPIPVSSGSAVTIGEPPALPPPVRPIDSALVISSLPVPPEKPTSCGDSSQVIAIPLPRPGR